MELKIPSSCIRLLLKSAREGARPPVPSLHYLLVALDCVNGDSGGALNNVLRDLDGHFFKFGEVVILDFLQMDGVELAAGGAKSAAKALICVELSNAAAEAAGGFLFHHF